MGGKGLEDDTVATKSCDHGVIVDTVGGVERAGDRVGEGHTGGLGSGCEDGGREQGLCQPARAAASIWLMSGTGHWLDMNRVKRTKEGRKSGGGYWVVVKRYLILKMKGRLSVLMIMSLTGCNWMFEVVVAVVVVCWFLAGKNNWTETVRRKV